MLPIESKIDPYLGRSFSCQCGRTHRTDVEAVFEGKEAIPSLLCILLSGKYSSVLFVEDVNTHSCTAPFLEPVYQGLKKAGIDFRLLVFPEEEFHPDEKAVGRVLMEMDESTSLLIAVGSGSLNDVCK